MIETREILWKAWPKGFVPGRGVFTQGGWMCSSESPLIHTSPSGVPYGYPFVGMAMAAYTGGDLLPVVDPKETATWACLLADLGAAAPLGRRYDAPLDNLTWEKEIDYSCDDAPDAWVLRASGGRCHYFWGIETDDPALALVQARIQLREE